MGGEFEILVRGEGPVAFENVLELRCRYVVVGDVGNEAEFMEIERRCKRHRGVMENGQGLHLEGCKAGRIWKGVSEDGSTLIWRAQGEKHGDVITIVT